MLGFYKYFMLFFTPLIQWALIRRQKRGKEPISRLSERMGEPSREKPPGNLVWLHAASVGESQAALRLIQVLLEKSPDLHVLVTSGTVTSAEMLEKSLPERAFHQFYPVDHPKWTENFLKHWKPDLALWMESEIWPNMLVNMQKMGVKAVIINGRMSEKSYKHWKQMKKTASRLLRSFQLICAQTETHQTYFHDLGAKHVVVSGNIKYSALPLPMDKNELKTIQNVTSNRQIWVYASSHKGEEALVCRVHKALSDKIPGLLSIIVPRHPARRDEIAAICTEEGLTFTLRGEAKNPPQQKTEIYVADTMGELGLFYTLSEMACIGRSFSDDGGGGHNPIEAAQLNCAVVYGPHVQFQQEIFDAMKSEHAAIQTLTEEALADTILWHFTNLDQMKAMQEKALKFARDRDQVLETVLGHLQPYLDQAGLRFDDLTPKQHSSAAS